MLDCFRTHCPKCPRKRRIVPGGGPIPCRVLYVGEAPGEDEDRKGVAFTGKAGLELNYDYLPRAGTPRDEAYVTNTVLCRPDDNKKPDDWIKGLAWSCAVHHLPDEIEAVRPEIVVLMGATACELVQGEPVNLETDHGIAQENVLFGEKRRVFPTYHPALGLHDSRAIKDIRDDFENLGRELERPWSTVPKDRYEDTDYGVLESREDWELVEWGLRDGLPLAVDTETSGKDDEDASATPFSLQFSLFGGWGRLLYADDTASVRRLNSFVRRHRPKVILHNAPYDLPVSARMGLDLYGLDWDDTMFQAMQFGMRQSLKVLGWRICGVRMKSFEELVRPYWEIEAWKFLREVRLFADGGVEDPEKVPVTIKKGKKKGTVQMRRPLTHFQRVNRIFMDKEKGKDVDPGARWGLLPEDVRRDLEEVSELRMPEFSILYAPREDVVEYGCRDADVTLRVWEELSREDLKERFWLEDIQPFDVDNYQDLVGTLGT